MNVNVKNTTVLQKRDRQRAVCLEEKSHSVNKRARDATQHTSHHSDSYGVKPLRGPFLIVLVAHEDTHAEITHTSIVDNVTYHEAEKKAKEEWQQASIIPTNLNDKQRAIFNSYFARTHRDLDAMKQDFQKANIRLWCSYHFVKLLDGAGAHVIEVFKKSTDPFAHTRVTVQTFPKNHRDDVEIDDYCVQQACSWFRDVREQETPKGILHLITAPCLDLPEDTENHKPTKQKQNQKPTIQTCARVTDVLIARLEEHHDLYPHVPYQILKGPWALSNPPA
eukprot:GILJ01011009.1.p1 GENE.GILJ01011009.1~~GILJ01011009.1.p1  ORF type:complete len:279 (+),score=29.92 GILJ01011009.1:482-1318(+)